MKCRLCNQPLFQQRTLAEILALRPLTVAKLCPQCRSTFQAINQTNCCPDCGRAQSGGTCRDCLRWRQMGEPALQNRGIFTYNDAMKAWIERYKGIGDYNLRDSFVPEITTLLALRRTAFVPLTTEPKHYRERGFDPVVGLFSCLPLQMWLEKDNTDLAQAKKNRAARMRTPQSFRCVASIEKLNRYPQICLLDDLYTTGRTLHHAAAAIRAGGYAGEVISRSLIR